ncbi:hypothetical protein Tco_1092552 [Tanacetum coccineum]|uniref:Uncharacterized protein n=1 Tax=Tanacetum coccineum TaxID=301880 RepID=A0ABQ5IBG9_9ASTR
MFYIAPLDLRVRLRYRLESLSQNHIKDKVYKLYQQTMARGDNKLGWRLVESARWQYTVETRTDRGWSYLAGEKRWMNPFEVGQRSIASRLSSGNVIERASVNGIRVRNLRGLEVADQDGICEEGRADPRRCKMIVDGVFIRAFEAIGADFESRGCDVVSDAESMEGRRDLVSIRTSTVTASYGHAYGGVDPRRNGIEKISRTASCVGQLCNSFCAKGQQVSD